MVILDFCFYCDLTSWLVVRVLKVHIGRIRKSLI